MKQVTILNGITSIGRAFYNCSGLTSIKIPSSVTSIGSFAFSDCSGLTSIDIPSSVTSIDSYAFQNCSSLTSISIPDSVTSIGYSAFSGCSSLNYNEYDSALYLGNANNPYLALVKAKNKDITTCTIHEKTKVLLQDAFRNCSSLTNISIPDSVTSIYYSAFYDCSGLTDVYYTGTEEEWAKVTIFSNNDYLINATIHYNYVPEE